MCGAELVDLHGLGQFHQELRISRQMMDRGGLAPGEAAHRFDARPVRDRREFRDSLEIAAKRLHGERALQKRADAHLVVVPFIFIGAAARCGAAPDTYIDHPAPATALGATLQ